VSAAVVVDIGNTRIKWGRCLGDCLGETVSLLPDAPADWLQQVQTWQVPPGSLWVLSSVHPRRCATLAAWLQQQGFRVQLLDAPVRLPLRVELERPDHVGIDRLLDAVAANQRRRSDVPAVIVDAGSAVTIDYVDVTGAFRGGAIIPGLRLMAQALHDYTALLPLVRVDTPPPLVGINTPQAMQAGLFWTLIGSIEQFVRLHRATAPQGVDVFLTGGDAPLLATRLPAEFQLWPEMTLEGIRLAAGNHMMNGDEQIG
jgi:type III pantothenate kinase